MAKPSFEELVNEYLECIRITSIIDYGDKSSVRKNNKAVDRMIKISKYISVNYHSRIEDFAELLQREDMDIDLWVAHHILENMDYPPELEDKALDVIIKSSNEDSVEGLGNRMWLETWFQKRIKPKTTPPE